MSIIADVKFIADCRVLIDEWVKNVTYAAYAAGASDPVILSHPPHHELFNDVFILKYILHKTSATMAAVSARRMRRPRVVTIRPVAVACRSRHASCLLPGDENMDRLSGIGIKPFFEHRLIRFGKRQTAFLPEDKTAQRRMLRKKVFQCNRLMNDRQF